MFNVLNYLTINRGVASLQCLAKYPQLPALLIDQIDTLMTPMFEMLKFRFYLKVSKRKKTIFTVSVNQVVHVY